MSSTYTYNFALNDFFPFKSRRNNNDLQECKKAPYRKEATLVPSMGTTYEPPDSWHGLDQLEFRIQDKQRTTCSPNNNIVVVIKKRSFHAFNIENIYLIQ